MRIDEAFWLALRTLAANKLRSILTMLGTIIGVAAVLTLISVGRGMEKYVTEQFASIGTNLLFVIPGQINEGPAARRTPGSSTLTLSDVESIANLSQSPDIAAIAPEVVSYIQISHKRRNMEVQVSGTTPDYVKVRSWSPRLGNFFSESDLRERRRVVVLGTVVYQRLFEPNEYPIEQTVQINNLTFRVIGVMEEKGGSSLDNLDEQIFMPFTTAQDRLLRLKTISGDYKVSVIYISVRTAERMDAVQEEVTILLRKLHNISYLNENDFSIINQSDLLSIFGDISGALTLFLSAIAGISLLVGGIGIMNIMLVSVTERTREIGLRKAVGAKSLDILGQFLMEAVALALSGGLLGIALGVGGAKAISGLRADFTAVVSIDVILISILFSMAVGLFFGIYPAYRASRLNPIEALRYE
jgi:putative ABC transport system permease protein